MKLYFVTDSYIEYLSKYDSRVSSNKIGTRTHGRKYLGLVLEINSVKYFAPLASPKKSDYTKDAKGNQIIRKSIVPIIRMLHKGKNENISLLGTIKLNNVIPVPDSELINYDASSESDLRYKNLISNEWKFIRQNEDIIKKNALTIYTQKTKRKEIGYLKHTVDFKVLEKACKAFP